MYAVIHVSMSRQHGRFTIEFADRGEAIRYAENDLALSIPHTWCAGNRIFCDGIQAAPGAARLAADRREAVIRNLCTHFDTRSRELIFMLDEQDPDRVRLTALLQELAAGGHRVRVEYDSEARREERRDRMYLGILRAGRELNINGADIADEDAYRRWKQAQGRR